MILKTVGILDVPFEVHAFSQLVSHIILFVFCETSSVQRILSNFDMITYLNYALNVFMSVYKYIFSTFHYKYMLIYYEQT